MATLSTIKATSFINYLLCRSLFLNVKISLPKIIQKVYHLSNGNFSLMIGILSSSVEIVYLPHSRNMGRE